MTDTKPQRRSILVTILTAVVFILSMWDGLQLYAIITRQNLFRILELGLPLWLLILSNGISMVLWALIGFGLWLERELARKALIVFWVIYQITTVVWKAITIVGPYERGQIIGQSIAAVIMTTLILFVATRPVVVKRFQTE